jgi:hypothetical protein
VADYRPSAEKKETMYKYIILGEEIGKIIA